MALFKYLGLEFTGSISLRSMLHARMKAAALAWGKLVGTIMSLGWKDKATRLLGDAFMCSSLLFGGPVWGMSVLAPGHDMVSTDAPLIDAAYRRYLRQLTGLPRNTTCDVLHVLTCRHPARLALGKAVWRYWEGLTRYPRAAADVATWAADLGEGPQALVRYRGKLTFGAIRAFHSRFGLETEMYRAYLAGV